LLQNYCFTTKLLSLLSGFLAINQSNYMHDNSSVCNNGNNTLLLLFLKISHLVLKIDLSLIHFFFDDKSMMKKMHP